MKSFSVSDIGEASSIRSPAIISNGLVVYWPLSEGTGSIMYDLSGNNQNGTYFNVNSSFFVQGKVGNAIYPNNQTSQYGYVTSSLNGMAGIVRSGSVSCWFYLPSAVQNTIWGDWNTNNGTFVRLETNGSMTFASYPANDRINSPAGSYTYGQWAFFTWQWEGTQLHFYVNATSSATVAITQDLNAGTNFTVGTRSRDTSQNVRSASIAEMRIYNRALSQSEIATIWSSYL